MDKLPPELVLHIAYCADVFHLDAFDIVKLHLVSRKLRETTRDSEFWKRLCFEDSNAAASKKRRDLQFIAPSSMQDPARVFELQRRARAISINSGLGRDGSESSKISRPEISRALADWDPTYQTEKVDWYEEYIARHAPISMSWLQQPGGIHRHDSREIKGLGRYRRGEDSLIVAPLDDGALSLWHIGNQDNTTQTKAGKIVAQSKSNLFSTTNYETLAPDKIECVSVDQMRNKAYVAVINVLVEVDLETLQVSSRNLYPFQISALSEATYPVPLTVATTNSLHLHDPREQRHAGRSGDSPDTRVECNAATLPPSLNPRADSYSLSRQAPLSQPGSLSIIHLSASDQASASDGYICVAGRYPSILTYNRRMFPRLDSTIHSGSRLAGMTSLPHPLLHPRPNPPSDPYAAHTLIACGEYNGKGSLELYPFSTSGEPNPASFSLPTSDPQPSILPYKNRISASRSKLLSVTPHGTRIVFSDGDGGLKWVERDGHSLVRRWNINAYTASTSPPSNHSPPGIHDLTGLFADSTQDGGSVARKILPVGPWEDGRGELAVWTGERIGVLGFRPKARFEWEREREREDGSGGEEALYAGRMRRALKRQADEVRFVRGMGLDS
ncbi:MAG: hypothetical protein Q9219_002944 [cf. Caloplaca sp. 3 TL-2023]